MPPMGDNADARTEGLAAQQDPGEQQDPNAGAGAQASLTATADQNGTEAAAGEQTGHGAPVQEITARVEALEQAITQLEAVRQAAPPDAEAIGKVVADLEGRLNSLVLKLRHML